MAADRVVSAGEHLLLRLSTALALEARSDVVVRAALDALVTEVGAATAAVFFFDEETRISRLVQHVNYPEDMQQQLREVSLSAPNMSNIAILTGEVQVIESRDAASEAVQDSRAVGERMGLHAGAAVPLLAGGRRLGVLVYGLAEPHTFSPEELSLLREVGNCVAAALERSRLEEELSRRADEAELLHSIALVAAGEDDLARMLHATLSLLSSLLAFTGGSIAFVENETLVIRAAMGPFSASALGQSLPRGRGRTWRVIETGEPFLSNDLAADGLRGLSSDSGREIRSFLAAPLIWRGETFGILQVDSLEAHVFRAADVALLQRVATLLSGPIELARRYAFEVQLRHELDEARGRLEAILEHAPMGIVFHDRDHRLAYANSIVHTPLGLFPRGELTIGRPWDELIALLIERRWVGEPADLLAAVERTRVLRNGILVTDLPLHSPEQHVLRIAAPVFESGEFSGHVILFIDVTVERQALAAAERAVALRDRFISIASHELKTPLTSIKGVAQLALRMRGMDPTPSERLWRHMETIDVQANRLRLLIDDLLDVSRMQAGWLDLRPEDADLAALVAAAVETLPESERARVTLRAPGVVAGHWDTLRLDQVIMNLLDNATKYCLKPAPIDVRVAIEEGQAVLSVTDHGIGIPADDLPELFAPFARASNASIHNESSLGLGLYITRQIVERHGGTIAVVSVEGEGSTFTVRLPVERDE
ncbi:MAG TPA: GAF domain-containing protein [Thermomicrobiales bacterium]|nr:GAF domain-containing protein [Thermomicrobiales bacterium]